MRAAVFVVMLLAGCESTPAPTTVEVRVPVHVSCVTARPVRPAYDFGALSMVAPDGEKVLALARDWPRGRKYEGELEAVIEGCL